MFVLFFSAIDSLLFMINSISFFKFSLRSFEKSKYKTKGFGISYHNDIFFNYYIFFSDYNNFIKLLLTFVEILLCRYKRYSICLLSVFNLYELFPAFICDDNIESLVNDLFAVKTFNPVPSVTSSSSP